MGEDFFVEWRKKENVRPLEIPNKSKLYPIHKKRR